MTKYFKTIPNTSYTFDFNGQKSTIEMKSINTKVSFTDLTIDTTENFYPYESDPGERLDLISDFYYKDTDRFWVIMLSNQALDTVTDFSMSSQVFERYILRKYRSFGSSDGDILSYVRTEPHSYYDSDGYVIDKTTYDSLAPINRKVKSIYDFEEEINDNKRKIKLASNTYITNIERQFKDLMKIRKV